MINKTNNYRNKLINSSLALSMMLTSIQPVFAMDKNNEEGVEITIDDVDSDSIEEELISEEKAVEEIKLQAQIIESGVALNDDESIKISDNWDFSKTYTLRIQAAFVGSGSKKIKLKLPLGMKLQSTPESIVDNKNVLSVDTSNFNKINIQTNGSYIHKPKVGELVYEIAPESKQIAFDILIKVDEEMWNTVEGVLATEAGNKAIEISALEEDRIKTYKLDEVHVIGKNWTPYFNGEVPSSVLNNNQGKITLTLTPNYIQDNDKRLFKKIHAWLEVPKVELNGETIYATVNSVQAGSGGTYKRNGDYLVFEWDNLYLDDFKVEVSFQFDVSELKTKTNIKIGVGEIYVESHFNNEIVKVLDKKSLTTTLTPDDLEDIVVTSGSRGVYKDNDLKNYSPLMNVGRFGIDNKGISTGKKEVRFTFPSGAGSGIGVRSIRIFAPPGSYRIYYTLWNEETYEEISGIKEFNQASGTAYLFTITEAKKMISNISKGNWSFKEIYYNIDSFPKGYSEKAQGSSRAGNIHAVVFEKATVGSKYTSTMTLTSYDKDGNKTTTDKKSSTATIEKTGNTVMGIHSHSVKDTSGKVITEITAGNSFRVSGVMEPSEYPYYNTTFSSNPVYIIRAPKGVSLDLSKSTVTINTPSGGKKGVLTDLNEQNYEVTSDGYRVYRVKVTLEDGTNPGIGYYSENLGRYSNMNFDFYFNTSRSAKTMALKLNEFIFLGDTKIGTTCSGYWDKYCTTDVWDIDKDGSYTDRIPTVEGNGALNIVANGNWLETELNVSINDGEFSTTGKPIRNSNDILNVKLSINNNNEGVSEAGGFSYYIPIPKKNRMYPSNVKDEDERFDFDLALTEFLTEVNGFEITYSVDNVNFVLPNSISDINDVSMIRVVSTKDILDGEKHDFIAKLKYDDGTIINQGIDGNDVIWGAYGSQSYSKNGITMSINHAFEKIKTEFISDPKISKQPVSQAVQVGERVSFEVKVDRGIPYANGYWEYRENENSEWMRTEVTDTELVLDEVTKSQNGFQYRYVLNNKYGDFYSDIATLTVYSYSVVIPKTINHIVDGDGSTTHNYELKVSGLIGENDTLSIIPIDGNPNLRTFELLDATGVKEPKEVKVIQEQTDIVSKEISLTTTKNISGRLEFPTLTAGEWSGCFDFYVKLVRR